MPRITETATLAVDPKTLWKQIGSFDSVGDWHPMLESVEMVREGKDVTRIAHGNAGEQTERLQRLDPRRHFYRYTLERSSIPVCDYTGEFRIDPAGDAASTVVWSAKFELTDEGDGRTVEFVRKFLHVGTEALKQKFGEAS